MVFHIQAKICIRLLMNNTSHVIALVTLSFGVVAQAATTRPSDLDHPRKRQGVVQVAEQLVRPRVTKLPADLSNPFNPPDFDARQQEGQKVAQPSSAAIHVEATDQETLNLLASLIPSAGKMSFQGKREVAFGARRMAVGQVLTV